MDRKQRTYGLWFLGELRFPTAIAIVALATTGLCDEPAAALDRPPTAQEQEACKADVFRLCRSVIPDVAAITSCLKINFGSLSEPCRKVMSVRVSGTRGSK